MHSVAMQAPFEHSILAVIGSTSSSYQCVKILCNNVVMRTYKLIHAYKVALYNMYSYHLYYSQPKVFRSSRKVDIGALASQSSRNLLQPH